MSDTEIEAVAKAICEASGSPCHHIGHTLRGSLGQARAAIAALDAHRASAGTFTFVSPNLHKHLSAMSRDVKFTEGEANILRAAASALATPEPTVKPDRETVAQTLHDEMCGCSKPAPWSDHDREDYGGLADAILALWPGKTEREVAEAAWDDCTSAWLDTREYGNPPENPHLAKGASNG